MQVEIQVHNSAAATSRFVTWAAAPCRVRVTDPTGAAGPTVPVDLSFTKQPGGGEVQFAAAVGGPFSATLTLPAVPTGGGSVPFFVAGVFGMPSTAPGDVTIQATAGGAAVGSVDVMVRVRKDANTLMPDERKRFVDALGALNARGTGRFVDFRDMHVAASDAEMHRNPGFLPWHRAYLLDLERELQAIDSAVALPYWRFDRPAPNVFAADFMGESDTAGAVTFAPGHALEFWTTDGVIGVDRDPRFNTATKPANVSSEATTLALGATFKQFRNMEGDPHGSAHLSFFGFIDNPGTAPKDPLFFLLHCNVDRLWAKWQQANNLFNPGKAAAFFTAPSGTNRVGHNLDDTMWPWNGITTSPRPTTIPAPGGGLAVSPFLNDPWPGMTPRVRDMFDYRGGVIPGNFLGFDYDDVPV